MDKHKFHNTSIFPLMALDETEPDEYGYCHDCHENFDVRRNEMSETEKELSPIENLKALLCDKDGNVSIEASDEDKGIIKRALTMLEQANQFDLNKPALFEEGCFGIRSEIELIKSFVVNWMQHPELKEMCFTEAILDRKTEIFSNLKLAFRHLEDARMRIGKAVQAYDGGKSCYPR